MPRGKALQLGQYYHIYNRGNNRQNVFVEQRNYRYFLTLFAQHIYPIADTYAYCLMPNHFHVLLRIKSADEIAQKQKMSDFSEKSDIFCVPTRAFAAFFTAYTKDISKAYNRTGRLFQEHFGRKEVTTNSYFTNLIFYIHYNPQKHGFVADFRGWPWSSFPTLTCDRPTHVARTSVLDWYGGVTGLRQFHQGVVDERSIAALIDEDIN